MTRPARFLPLAAALAVAAIPLVQHARTGQAELLGEAFLQRLADSQREFRRHGAGFAASLDSLTTPCPGDADARLVTDAVRRVRESGFDVSLRPAQGASTASADCHGQATTTDFYAALRPASVAAAPRRAYAVTGLSGRVFVFFDGVAPVEPDMAPGGLATPLDTLGRFRIP